MIGLAVVLLALKVYSFLQNTGKGWKNALGLYPPVNGQIAGADLFGIAEIIFIIYVGYRLIAYLVPRNK